MGAEEFLGYAGPFAVKPLGRSAGRRMGFCTPGSSKVCNSIEQVIDAVGLKDGMTVSFHHHLRDGDYVLNMVLEACARKGLKDLTVATSSIFPVHSPLVSHVKNGVVSRIVTSYVSGPVGEAISRGEVPNPVLFQTHGGRARAIESGELRIDVAFIAAPTADRGGNISGVLGPSACGSLGYAVADAMYADAVVAVTDNLVQYPLPRVSIPGIYVDYVVRVDRIGDPKAIVSGTTRITRDPLSLKIASDAASVIACSGLLKEGISFQTGAGGISLAVAHFVRQMMESRKIRGSFGLGGITGYFVNMLEHDLFDVLLDVQCFDLESVRSLAANPRHREISCSEYANPWTKGCAVNYLDVVVLGATEIDVDFNVNVLTSSDGVIMGGSGGHSDAAAGSKLTMIVSPSTRTRLPIIRERVTTVTTPGDTVDVLVTERGICVNPARTDLLDALRDSGLKVKDIRELLREVENVTGKPAPAPLSEKVVGYVQYRDGTILDTVRAVRTA